MIVKEKEGSIPTDKMGRAGYDAEKQMAFYLRRAFSESPDIFVFNDIRFVRNGEAAQIDHLVLHRYGFFLIESKSVTGAIEVNKQLEFVRVFGRQRKGMKSPITQVKMQADLLQALLNDNKESLRRKLMLGMVQGSFGEQRFDRLVAVSDNGIINRKGCDPPGLVKADRVASVVEDLIARRDKTRGFTGAMRLAFADKKTTKQLQEDDMPAFTAGELDLICSFLLDNDQPYVQPPPVVGQVVSPPETPPPLPAAAIVPSVAAQIVRESPAQTQSSFSCRHCNATNVEIIYGQYGYYFKCNDCSKNTKIDFTCRCGVKSKISKKGQVFSWKCSSCGNNDHFYTNPS
ncbi:nuclease-related domain-containing protein [Gimesia maris]|uniref:nuclease-related domain-containing protein n=1 Tax=Gimesia maris TaxID=122 RepID=UPI003A94C8A2